MTVNTARRQSRPTVRSDSLVATIVTVESAACQWAARELAAVGVTTVIGFASAVTRAQDLVNGIRSDGGRAFMIPVDPTMQASAWAFVERVVAQLGALHLLVCDVATLASPRYQPSVRGPWSPLPPLEAAEFLCGQALAAMSTEDYARITLLGDDTNEGLQLLRQVEETAIRTVSRSACVASVESLSTTAADESSDAPADVTAGDGLVSFLLGPDVRRHDDASRARSRDAEEE